MNSSVICPACNSPEVVFKHEINHYVCRACLNLFQGSADIGPQTIFLSYAHKSEKPEDFDDSEELAWLVKQELENDGHRVWIDREGIRGGMHWREQITDAILHHRHFLAFLSRRSVRNAPNVCLNEVAIAIRHHRIIQTILTESESLVSAPLTLSSIQWHKFEGWRDIRAGKTTGPNGEEWTTWFSELMSEIRLNLEDISHQRTAGELSQLNNILRPTTFEAAIIASVDGFFGRQWLFDAVHQWLQSDHRIFWLQGAPGIGKSAFAAKLVHRGDSAIVGYFKCDFQAMKSAEESATECIRTLAYQLATRLPDYRVKLLRGNKLEQLAVDINNLQAKQDKTPDDLFRYLIAEPLNRMEKIGEANRMALVIDAMDEAGRWVNGKIVNPLADLVYKHADQLPDWLGIIITSRPEAYLQQQLASKFNPIVIDGDNRDNIRDLEDYLGTRLPDEITGHQRQQIIQTIIEKSGGTFLYIKRVEISYDLSKPEILPSGLDDFLYRDFERYCPDLQIYEEKTEKFLRLLAAAPGPVPAQLAQELLGWPAREIARYVTQPLASLLTETTEGIRFFHKSMKEWLLDGRRSGFYQVNDDGAKLLGNFLWRELKKKIKPSELRQVSKWQKQIRDWLPDLSLMNSISGVSYVIVDVETTGLTPENGRITRIDAVRITNGVIDYDSLFSEYVNPGQDIPPEIQKITGITNDVVRHAPEIDTVLLRFHEFIDGSILVSHHAVFPKRFLAAAADACRLPHISLPWLCTMKLSRELFKDQKCSLTSVCQYLEVAIDDNSLDVFVEAECFLKLKELMVSKFDKAASHLA